uniref:Uncharacterized protein n=1 Tax=Arundo donax TaxID=35708 RepID=A0A0A9HGL5_ARUDO
MGAVLAISSINATSSSSSCSVTTSLYP